MADTLQRDPLMPRDVDHDGIVCWHTLGTIARINGDDRWSDITAAEAEVFDDNDWDALAADTPELDAAITPPQRARIIETLTDLEHDDLGRDDRWWDR